MYGLPVILDVYSVHSGEGWLAAASSLEVNAMNAGSTQCLNGMLGLASSSGLGSLRFMVTGELDK